MQQHGRQWEQAAPGHSPFPVCPSVSQCLSWFHTGHINLLLSLAPCSQAVTEQVLFRGKGRKAKASLTCVTSNTDDPFSSGLAYSSGMAAILNICHLLKTGDAIICMNEVYGGGYSTQWLLCAGDQTCLWLSGTLSFPCRTSLFFEAWFDQSPLPLNSPMAECTQLCQSPSLSRVSSLQFLGTFPCSLKPQPGLVSAGLNFIASPLHWFALKKKGFSQENLPNICQMFPSSQNPPP